MLADLVERIDKDPTLENITLGDISQAYHGHQFSRKHAIDLGFKDPGELSFMGYIESAKEYTKGREIASRSEIAEEMELLGYKIRKDYHVVDKNQKEETNKGGKNESVKNSTMDFGGETLRKGKNAAKSLKYINMEYGGKTLRDFHGSRND